MPETEMKAPVSIHGRSVVDFVDEKELKDALLTVTPQGIAKNDWILPVPDPEAEEQTVESEMARLLTLKSYMLLDAENEEAFDKLTEEARELFGVPTSLISLIDLGRQFLFSNTGADVRETQRDVAFCSHTILNKKGIVVVEDCQEDDRFKENPLVTEAPHLRFYAGAPLVSPEGHKLGTFCVEGPEPRAFSEEDKKKLKEYAGKTMEMMVERRKKLRDRLAGVSVTEDLLRHAAVTTNLGDAMFLNGDSVTAMQLFQESIQTIMHSESEASQGEQFKPTGDRHKTMVDLLRQLLDTALSADKIKEIMAKVKGLFGDSKEAQQAEKHANSGLRPQKGIPGLFNPVTKMKGVSAPRPLPPLVFSDTFTIDLSETKDSFSKEDAFPLDERPFTVPISECSKATLFNMGLIHYHWSRPDMALQFFHLAASVSYKMSPLKFDPVDLTAVGNMSQIHLLLRKPEDAMSSLEAMLKRGNATLAEIYKSIEQKSSGANHVNEEKDDDDEEALAKAMEGDNDEAARKTRRLRRKIARTLLDVGHVHFFSNDLDAALASCKEAMTLLDDHMTGVTMSAVYFNMAMILHHQRKSEQALACVEKFFSVSSSLIGVDHSQRGDAMQLKGEILFDMGKAAESVEPLTEAMRIRSLNFGENSGILVETLGLLGKAQLGLNQVDESITTLTKCLELERKTCGSQELTFEAAQSLLDLGRAYQIKGNVEESLEKYLEVIGWARSFFGTDHPFTGRIAGIIGNLHGQAGNESESKKFLEEAAATAQAATN